MTSPRLSLPILAAGMAGFLTTGLLQAMYGPAFPFVQQHFGVGPASVGAIASAHFLGSACAPLLVAALLGRFSVRWVTVGALLCLLLGAAMVALSPTWGLALLGACLGGLGAGGTGAALNSTYAALGTRAVNLVNAVFGIGSVLSPLAVVALAPHGLAWPFVLVGSLSLLTLLVLRVWGVPLLPARANQGHQPNGSAFLLAAFALLLGAYVALEVGFGAWAGAHLAALGWKQSGLIVSAYWAGLTLARIGMGIWGGNWNPRRVVQTSLLLSAGAAALAWAWPALAPLAYPLAGLMLGPVFATTLVWMTRNFAPERLPIVMVAGSLGGMISPVLLGWAAPSFGTGGIPALLALVGGVAWLVSLGVQQLEKTV